MPTATRVVVQNEPGQPLELREATLPDPGPHDVLVKIHASGVCQSQLFWMHAPHPDPMLFGHEGYGTVLATGSAVTHVREGAAVMITWLPRAADRNPDRASLDIPGLSTAHSPNVYTWADHTLVDELYVVPLDDRSRQDVVSVVGCAVLTGAGAVTHVAPVDAGGTVAVFGVGGVGLSAVAAAAVRGARHIIAVDLSTEKLQFSRKFGATHTIDAGQGDPVQEIIDITGGGVDVAVDCVALPDTVTQALNATRAGRLGVAQGGTAVIVGLPKKPLVLDIARQTNGNMLTGQKSLVGTTAGGCRQDDIATFLDWHHTGRLDLNALVTDRYPLTEINRAVADLAQGRILGRALTTT
ncbi:zinc-binding dehydrogenase [Streptomyces sp. NPDC058128]|uniref:zinc-binding dehydrogenase n=1 Tax=Streptomyces sp. NPDC058128 TaxID=3346352 RepID=UPI0036EF8878